MRIEQTLVPELRFPEFRDYGEWTSAKLGDLLKVTSSKRVHQSEWSDSGVAFYRARELVSLQKGERIEPLYISEELYEKNISLSGAISQGDLLVTGVGSIGVPYLVKANDRFYFKDGNIIWIKNDEQSIAGEFLYLLYSSDLIKGQIRSITGIGTVGTYTITNAEETGVTYPQKAEQQKIADCLGSLDDLIAAHSRKLTALQDHKKGLLQQLFPAECETTPKLRFPEFEADGEWHFVKLKPDLLDKVIDNRGKTPPISEEGYPLVEVNALGSRQIDYNRVTKYVDTETYENWFRGHVRSNDILFSTVGAIAETSMVCDGDTPVIAQNIVGLRIRGTYIPNFIHYLLSETANKNKFLRITMGAVQPSLKVSQMVGLTFFVPNKAEQQKIADCLSALDALINAQTEQIAALKEHKKGLMQKLFPNPDLKKA